ncbi:GSCOCG00005174001-RA-CDS [Cotesia congregata]|nr:GSCOCG00005174001-RA-CDS [Cotesia congregata]
MAGQIIWLMCYITLGLALTLGNRAGSHYHHNHRLRLGDQSVGAPNKLSSESDPSFRFNEPVYDLPPEWNLYDQRDFIDNSRGFNSNNNNINNNKALVNKLSSPLMENIDTRRDFSGPGRRLSSNYNNNKNNDNKRGLGDSDELPSGHRGSGSGNSASASASIVNQYDLNGRSVERRVNDNKLVGRAPLKSSSVWSLEPDVVEYPWKVQQGNGAGDVSNRIGNNAYARTLGKRNQVAGGRRKPGESRSTGQQGQPPPFLGSSIPEVAMGSMASQLMLRTARGNRQYDVPQIECPSSEDGMERFACPTPDRMGRYRCIDDHVLCDGFIDCPTGEDEDRQACMFYKTTKAHLDVLAEALLRWVRGR